jgi:hypothetical protein
MHLNQRSMASMLLGMKSEKSIILTMQSELDEILSCSHEGRTVSSLVAGFSLQVREIY